MRKRIVCLLSLVLLAFAASCAPTYVDIIKEQAESDNVTPISMEQAKEIQSDLAKEVIIAFVIKDNGISVDSVVNISKFHKGAEADVIYLVRNESSRPVTPEIFFAKYTRVDDYSAVDGQGFRDAPPFVEEWITVSPQSATIQPLSAQPYLVSFTMPNDNVDVPSKFAFQLGVAIGGKLQVSANPWWLVSMR